MRQAVFIVLLLGTGVLTAAGMRRQASSRPLDLARIAPVLLAIPSKRDGGALRLR